MAGPPARPSTTATGTSSRFHDDPVDWPWPHHEYVGDELGQMRFRIERDLNPRVVED